MILELAIQNKNLKLIKYNDVNKAYDDAFAECSDLINEYIKEINQKEHLHDVIYRIANNELQILDSKSIYQKYSILCDMGYIKKVSQGKYKIIDGFLREELLE